MACGLSPAGVVPPRAPIGVTVLRAIADGAETSPGVAALTGLPERKCAAWLSLLHAQGRIVRIGVVRFCEAGKCAYRYRLASAEAMRRPR